MDKSGKKDDRRPAKDSGASGLRAVQEVETTKRKQVVHETLQALIFAITRIVLALISRAM